MMLLRGNCFAILSCLLVFASSGCSEPVERFPVAGKVLIDGEPVSSGTIQFVPKSGRPVASKIGSDGSFRLVESSNEPTPLMEGVPAGEYRISVSSTEVLDENAGEVVHHIPAHYADYRNSELGVEIDAPDTAMVIDLTWEGFVEDDTKVEAEESGSEESGSEESGSEESGSEESAGEEAEVGAEGSVTPADDKSDGATALELKAVNEE